MTNVYRVLPMCLVLIGFGLAHDADAALLTVTSLADDGSPGTLRSKIAAAAAGDTIDFSVTGTIALTTTGALVINKDLTITGPGQGSLTVKGLFQSGGHEPFSIFRISNVNVGVSGLTLSNGDGNTEMDGNFGGAIRMSGGSLTVTSCAFSDSYAGNGGGAIYLSSGSLTATNCTFSDNYSSGFNFSGGGGAIYLPSGQLLVTDCTFSGNEAYYYGGAILMEGGTMAVSRSTITGNTAGDGGGILIAGSTTTGTITDSTISNNTADPNNGGLGHGGGIYNFDSGELTLTNCTISGNDANGHPNNPNHQDGGGGIYNNNSFLTLANCTVTLNSAVANGGGILNFSSPLFLSNTILANNTAGASGPDLQELGGTTSTFCLIGQDPKLGPLANNGGPTQTHALRSDSPALDAGDPNFDATGRPYDQRGAGFPRVRNGRVCIGAYEAEKPLTGSSFIVTTLGDHDDGIAGPTDCTLREAIKYAPSGATITFAVTGTITLTLGELVVDKSLTITGPTQVPGITVSGNHASRIIQVTHLPSVTTTSNFSNLTLIAGNGVSSVNNTGAGAIYIDNTAPLPTVTVTNCTFSDNHVAGGAGAIRNAGTLTVTGCTFSGNSSAQSGGAFQGGGTLTVRNSTFSGNSANGSGSTGLGGAISMLSGTLTVTGCTLSGNSASIRGGGLATGTSTVNLANNIVAGNTAPTGPDISGTAGGGGFNLVGDTAGATLTGPSNITGQAALLGPLANNGGPTQTRALLAGSPALNAGSNALIPVGVTTDQRGSARLESGTVDIGAFELDVTPPSVTINQAAGQTDPTISTPVRFTVVFSESVNSFTTGDVTLSGTAGATTATVTGSSATYQVTVSGMTGTGTVIATIATGVAPDISGNGNAVSTSTDNSIYYSSAETVQSSGTITAVEGGGGGYAVGFIGNPGQEYTIQFSSTMAPSDWHTLTTQVADLSGVISIIDNPPAGTPKRFYRLALP